MSCGTQPSEDRCTVVFFYFFLKESNSIKRFFFVSGVFVLEEEDLTCFSPDSLRKIEVV